MASRIESVCDKCNKPASFVTIDGKSGYIHSNFEDYVACTKARKQPWYRRLGYAIGEALGDAFSKR